MKRLSELVAKILAAKVAPSSPTALRILISSVLCALCISVAIPPPAFAQGCAMCSTTASAAGPGAAQALNLGILILLLPTLVLFVGVLVMAARRAAAN